MKVSDYILDYLVKKNIKTAFVLTGAAIADLIDAFSRNNKLNYVCVVHEQAGSFAAEAYSKVTENIGVAMVTSGPGGINLLTGMANCWYDSIPCVFITGQIHSEFIKKNKKIRQVGFQENDIVSMSKPVSKFSYLLRDPEKIKWALDRAFYEATTGRPGPVLIDLPVNIQKMNIDPRKLIGYKNVTQKNRDKKYLVKKIKIILEKLQKSDRPVLLIGGGIRLSKATKLARILGNKLGIPCLPTWNALDVFTSDYSNYRGGIGTYGGPGRNFAIQNSDFLLGIGTRISGRITGGMVGSFARGAYKVLVDIDPANVNPDLQQVKFDLNIQEDAGLFITLLLDELKTIKLRKYNSWMNKTMFWKNKYDPIGEAYQLQDKFVNPYVFIEELTKQLKKDDIIIADCGGNVVVTFQSLKTKFGQRLISSNGNSPMGFSFCAAIGACIANPKRRVICLIGDGGFTMNSQELQTVKNYGLDFKTFIMNNHVYGIIKAYQDTNLDGRYEASGPKGYKPPDFTRIANAYGIKSEFIRKNKELASKIHSVLNSPEAIVCDVNMGEHYKYSPRIFGWNTPIEDMFPYLPRDEFRKNMIIKPLKGWETPVQPSFNNDTSFNP